MPLRPRHYLACAPNKGEADPNMDQYGDECAPLRTRTKLAFSFLPHVSRLPHAAPFVADQHIKGKRFASFCESCTRHSQLCLIIL